MGRSYIMTPLVQLMKSMLIALLLSSSIGVSRAQICPRNCSLVTDTNNAIIVDMQCKDLGDLPQLPQTCNETRAIKVLTIGPEGTSVSRVQGLAFRGLRIVKLVLENIKIQEVDFDAFKGLGPTLEVLYLNDNLLSSLPSGLFSELTALTMLQLHSNRLTSLWSVPVSSLNGLQVQPSVTGDSDAASTELNSSLATLVNLQRLTLYDNQIENISSKLFASLGKMQNMTLQENRIQSLPSDTFSSLRSLTSLNISSNYLTVLPNDLFASNPSVKLIDLSSNRISFVSERTFTNVSQLTALYLQDNRMNELLVDTFIGLQQLVTIRLDNNGINTTYSNSLTGMPLLRELHLQNNMISVLPIGIFDPVGSLTLLNLSNNRISRIEKIPFSSQSNLNSLDVSNNILNEIPADWFLYTRNLNTLLLENNLISSINATSFDNTLNLLELSLTNNLLTEDQLRGRFTKCVSLQTLRLDGNPLGSVTPQTFNGPPSLERLYLNSSCIRSANFDWRPDSLPILKELHLQNNFLERVSSEAFTGLVQLRTIDLGYNELSVIETSAFAASASTLHLLNLTQNNLDSSQLTSLASSSLNTTTVDLSWNNIKDIEVFPNIGHVYLAGNPINCNCSHFQGLVDLSSFSDYDSSVCSSGSSNLGPQLLVCYLSNSTICGNHTATSLTLPKEICEEKISTDAAAAFSMLRKEMRDRETARCGSPSNDTVDEAMPSLLYMEVIASDASFNLSWNVDDVTRVAGFKITWLWETVNSSSYVINDANQTHYVINHIQPKYNYTICVRIMLALDSTVEGSLKCQNVLAAAGCGPNTCKQSEPSNFMTWILYVIIPVAVVVLIIIIIIVVIVIRHKQGTSAQKTPAEATSPHPTSPPTISKGTNMNLAEHATVSVDMFDY